MVCENNRNTQLPCSSEFGLYRYHDYEDINMKKRIRFKIRYAVVLISAIIVLSGVCYIILHFVSQTAKPQLIEKYIETNHTKAETDQKALPPKNHTKLINIDQSNLPLKKQRNLQPPTNTMQRKIDIIYRYPKPFLYPFRNPRPTLKPPTIRMDEKEVKSYRHRFRAKNVQDIIKYLMEHQSEIMKNSNGVERGKDTKRLPSNVVPQTVEYSANAGKEQFSIKQPGVVNMVATNSFSPHIYNYDIHDGKRKKNVMGQYGQHKPLDVVLDIFPTAPNVRAHSNQWRPIVARPYRPYLVMYRGNKFIYNSLLNRHLLSKHRHKHNVIKPRNPMLVHVSLLPSNKSKYEPMDIPFTSVRYKRPQQIVESTVTPVPKYTIATFNKEGTSINRDETEFHPYYVLETNDTEKYFSSRKPYVHMQKRNFEMHGASKARGIISDMKDVNSTSVMAS